ncbi:MAG: aromatic ring-hydroxylating dioxygenase subunit alpha [Gammaproteobacteria bacterium]|nr:MAG: aromatic ring-hydroxylating dioxygenase subunit alpha [Gammaproteobacteria bacterium]
MAVYRNVERFADPQTSKTPAQKEPDPQLGSDFIPKERYTSKEFAAQEWDRLWTKVWNMGCWEGDLRNPGDYVVTQLGSESIVLTRDEQGGVNAFYNVCSHRGNRVAYGEKGNTRSFRCSYHLWEYDLQGRLINVPDEETFPIGAPCEKLSIRKLPCDTWGGWVWFSLNQNVEPLEDFLGMIIEHLDPYHFDRMTLVNDVTVLWECNWKAAVDAFNESYHVAGTHPQLMSMLEDYDVQIDCYDKHSRYLIPFATVSSHWEDGSMLTEAMRSYVSIYGFDLDAHKGDGLDIRRALQQHVRQSSNAMGYDFSDLNDDQLSDDYHYMIFPNITLNIHCNSVMLFRQRPHESDPNKMYFDLQNYTLMPEGESAPERPAHRAFKHGEESLGEVLDQDASNLPMIQAGMNSAGYRGLWISNQELRIRHFHKTIDDYLHRTAVQWVN